MDDYPYIAMDTEFPGVVARPVGNFKSSGEFIYQTLRYVSGEQLRNPVLGVLRVLKWELQQAICGALMAMMHAGAMWTCSSSFSWGSPSQTRKAICLDAVESLLSGSSTSGEVMRPKLKQVDHSQT